jgi:hypothetical protein
MKQKITVSLDGETIRKAKVLAARRDMSISRRIAVQPETLVGEDEAFERKTKAP